MTLYFVRRGIDEALFTHERPPHGRCVGSVAVRSRYPAAPPVVGNVALWIDDNSNNNNSASVPSPEKDAATTRNVPLLKSALQKCVRRNRVAQAAAIVRHLLAHRDTHADLLRRIVVIAVEDAVALPRIVPVVWLMAAVTKGYALDDADADFVADVIERLAGLPVRDCRLPTPARIRHVPAAYRPARLGALGNVALVDALLLRACYGGMPCDMSMLHATASAWQARLAASDDGDDAVRWSRALAVLDDAAAATASLVADDGGSGGDAGIESVVPVEAADFHCFAWLPAAVSARCRGAFDRDAVRLAIWHHRSGINHKAPWTDPRDPLRVPSHVAATDVPDDRVDADAVARTAACWSTVRPHVDQLARRAIADAFSVVPSPRADEDRKRPAARPLAPAPPAKRAQTAIDAFFVRRRDGP